MTRVTVRSAGDVATADYTSAPKSGPQSFPSLAAALGAGIGAGVLPPDPNAKLANGQPVYVTFPQNEPFLMLEEQFGRMFDGQVLVLPERNAEYQVDTFGGTDAGGNAIGGFRWSGVRAISNGGVEIPVASKYKGKTARTWAALARARRGILHLGPGAVINVADQGYQGALQVRPQIVKFLSAATPDKEMVGCQEKVIEFPEANAFWGNGVVRGRDLGPMAYGGAANGKTMVVERMVFDSNWRGSSFAPNTETGAIGVAIHTFRDVLIDGATTGKTSAMMANSAGGSTLTDVTVKNTAGSITYWNMLGQKSTWRNVVVPTPINMEANQAGFELDWQGGSVGGKSFHLNIRSPHGSQRLTLTDVVLTGGLKTIVGNIWSSGSEPRKQLAVDVRHILGGVPQPVKLAGL